MTRERYQIIIRDDKTKSAFKDFFYFFNENDVNDKNNSKEKKFNNPHLNLTNTQETRNSLNLSISSFSNIINNNLNSKSMADKMLTINQMDSKLSKIKLISSSVSSSNLIRNRVMSSSNITSNSSTSSGYSLNNALNNKILHKKLLNSSTRTFNY
jgi:hypothetical protein